MVKKSIYDVAKVLSPIKLGQSSQGILFSIVMILLWFGTMRVGAAALVQGSSANDSFKIDWEYDLVNGLGKITFIQPMGTEYPYSRYVLLDSFSFTTVGVELTMSETNETLFSRSEVGTINGQTIYQYDIDSDELDNYVEFSFDSYYFFGSEEISFSFPTDDIQITTTKASYKGMDMLSGAAPLALLGEMDFASVQVVPEPTTVGMLGLGAMLAAARSRKEEN